MNSFHKSSTITSVPIKACQAFSSAGETTLENKTTVVATWEMYLYLLLHFTFSLCQTLMEERQDSKNVV